MKAKLHIDINTYEFVEFELEAENDGDLQKQILFKHRIFHKLIELANSEDELRNNLRKLNKPNNKEKNNYLSETEIQAESEMEK